MLNKKKKNIIIGLAAAVIVVGVSVFILIRNSKFNTDNLSQSGNINQLPAPKFMSVEEKSSLNLPADSKIQVLKTDESGKTEVYRVIRKDADIILDPSRIADPDMTRPAVQSAQ
ncbi:MAG: hypothetical protein HY931_04115 [Candidatus Falkowbacteria bacterium]|nr:MAG: hypothetical protein HY931_04115 [Candidatus Falkowbacteria bacterium]